MWIKSVQWTALYFTLRYIGPAVHGCTAYVVRLYTNTSTPYFYTMDIDPRTHGIGEVWLRVWLWAIPGAYAYTGYAATSLARTSPPITVTQAVAGR